MIVRLRQILFSLIVFSLISQFGKHFWPSFAFISGIRVDYLSPTLYFSDLLILVLLCLSLSGILKQMFSRVSLSLLAIQAVLILSVILAKNELLAAFGVLKIVELYLLGLFIVSYFKQLTLSSFYFPVSLAVIIETVVVVWQTILQHSVGGIWYFLGERTFSAHTIGIATVKFANTSVLRAYGTFPHPNVLAFFMFFASVFLYSAYKTEARKERRQWYLLAIILASTVLILTFSRLIFLITALWWIWAISKSKSLVNKKALFGVFVTILISLMWLLPTRFSLQALLGEDFQYRVELLRLAFKILSNHLVFGVGLQNYLQYQFPLQHSISPILLQPVHSIYLLTIVQLGLIGSVPIFMFIRKTWSQYRSLLGLLSGEHASFVRAAFGVFWGALIVGLSDHFLVTLQQGQLMMTILLSLAWVRWENSMVQESELVKSQDERRLRSSGRRLHR